MTKMKWFAGGKSRSEEATELLTSIVGQLNDTKNQPLKDLLIKFNSQLSNPKDSVPFILSRMNISISDCISSDELTLSPDISAKLSKLISLSNIKYEY